MSLMPYGIVLAVLFIAILALLLYRHSLVAHEDDTLHVGDGEEKIMAEQAVLAKRLEAVEKWGKTLTAVFVLGALALGAYYIYLSFIGYSHRGL